MFLRDNKIRYFKTYAFSQVPDAHLQIESGRTAGKVVIEVKS
jgi:Zinc-binding dehydrogenase